MSVTKTQSFIDTVLDLRKMNYCTVVRMTYLIYPYNISDA
jgi:hypothetical protein